MGILAFHLTGEYTKIANLLGTLILHALTYISSLI